MFQAQKADKLDRVDSILLTLESIRNLFSGVKKDTEAKHVSVVSLGDPERPLCENEKVKPEFSGDSKML